MNLGSRSIVIPELLHFQHVQVLKERYVSFSRISQRCNRIVQFVLLVSALSIQ